MKRAAVFDTNVIVSGFISPHGPPGQIVEWLRAGKIIAIIDDRIMDEYITVLERPVFGIPKTELNIVLTALRHHAHWVTAFIEDGGNYLPDPDDAPFLECARAADVPLVTGNIKHFPQKIAGHISIITPSGFINLFSMHE